MRKKLFYKQTTKVDNNSTTTVYEIEKPSHFNKTVALPSLQNTRNNRWLVWIITSICMFGIVLVTFVISIGWWYGNSFQQQAKVKIMPIISEFARTMKDPYFGDRNYKTFLLLGIDQAENMRENSVLTDTIIFAIVKNYGEMKLVSIPRDLWIDSLKTKINALYYYGQQTNPGGGAMLSTNIVNEITGLNVDYYVLLNMDVIKSLIDVIGGIEVKVERSFEDKYYPREIDLNSKDMSVLYETIKFEAGLNHMDGKRALQYIRSRHSEDEFEGTDSGREKRQQVLLQAVKNSLLDPRILANPTITAKLYSLWKNGVESNISDVDILKLVYQFKNVPILLEPVQIPISDATNSGILYHPNTELNRQWVYKPVESSWSELKSWFSDLLK